MNEQTENLGDIVVAVGSYVNRAGETKTRNRNIGKLMKTGERYWIEQPLEILHASLFALVRSQNPKKGADTFTASVFAKRDESAPRSEPPVPGEEDGPF